MIPSQKQTGQVKVTVAERWRQVFRTGWAVLYNFSQAELEAVAPDPAALPFSRHGSFMQAMTPLMAAPPSAPGQGSWQAEAWSAAQPHGEHAATVVAGLERQGFVRPWPPAPADGPIANELAGWAAAPGGVRRPVALAGDLAIIASTRSHPVCIAEVSTSEDPAHAEPEQDSWSLAARMYMRYQPPIALVEQPNVPGRKAPLVLLRDDHALFALITWCIADITAFQETRATHGSDAAEPAALDAATVGLPESFHHLAKLRVAHARGRGTSVQQLIVASSQHRHWLLEGERWERVVSVSVGDLGQRISTILQPASPERCS